MGLCALQRPIRRCPPNVERQSPSGGQNNLAELIGAPAVPKFKLTARAVPKFIDHELSSRVNVPNLESAVRIIDRRWHQLWRLPARIAEHDALVACTLLADGDHALRNIDQIARADTL